MNDYRLASVARDTTTNTMINHSDNSDIWLYEVQYVESNRAGGTEWRNMCGGNGAMPKRGLFVDGRWRDDGSFVSSGYTFSCPSGVISKCVRNWGYKPWQSLDNERGTQVNLQPLHLACVRAARADYCGNGVSHTRDGTMGDMFDSHGFNVRELDSEFLAEASFDQGGATEIIRTRWPQDGDVNSLACAARAENPGGNDPFAPPLKQL